MPTPGEEIRKRLGDLGWTQRDLSRVLGRPLQTINGIIQGKKSVTPEMAIALGAAFGTAPELWLNLELGFRLSRVEDVDAIAIERRAKLYEYAPIKEMVRRGWIKNPVSIEDQERDLCKFFEVESLDRPPSIGAAMRKAAPATALSHSQVAWCFRAKHVAKALQVAPFKRTSLKNAASELRELAAYPEEARHVPKILAKYGIRFLVIEPLTSGKVDGATIWLDDRSPVIAVSLRYDRIDAFWFTLLHEFFHVVHGDASVDSDLCGAERAPAAFKEEAERRADNDASATLIPPEKFESFILRVSPLYSKTRIIQFAHTVNIHPGIIVGQLQHRGEIGWSANREMLRKIRGTVVDASLTDGWGHSIEVLL